MEGIGECLKNARQEKGLTLQQVEEETKIKTQYLENLENNNFKELPGRVYTIGFLRNYARYLDLDAESLVQDFKMLVPVKSERSENLKRTKAIKKSTFSVRKSILILLLIILCLLIGFWYTSSQQITKRQPHNEIAHFNEHTLQDNHESPKNNQTVIEEENQGQKTVAEGVKVTVKVVKDQCWIGVWDEEQKMIYSGILDVGDSKTFQSKKKLKIRFGNVGAVQVYQNGELLDSLGEDSTVLTREFGITE